MLSVEFRSETQCSTLVRYRHPGCDYYANVIYGARISLSIGVLSVIGVLIIGVLIGALAGYFGGAIDSVLARFTDVFFGIPLLLGALILLTVTAQRTIFTVSLALVPSAG